MNFIPWFPPHSHLLLGFLGFLLLPSVLLFAVELNPILTQENKASLSQLTALMPLSEEKSLSRVRLFATPLSSRIHQGDTNLFF